MYILCKWVQDGTGAVVDHRHFSSFFASHWSGISLQIFCDVLASLLLMCWGLSGEVSRRLVTRRWSLIGGRGPMYGHVWRDVYEKSSVGEEASIAGLSYTE